MKRRAISCSESSTPTLKFISSPGCPQAAHVSQSFKLNQSCEHSHERKRESHHSTWRARRRFAFRRPNHFAASSVCQRLSSAYLGTQNRARASFLNSAGLCNVVMISSMDGHARYYLRHFPELRNEHNGGETLWYFGGTSISATATGANDNLSRWVSIASL